MCVFRGGVEYEDLLNELEKDFISVNEEIDMEGKE